MNSKPMASTDGVLTEQHGIGQAIAKDKSWKQASQNEKIERMRTLIKSLVSQVDSLRRELNKSKAHSHDENGKAVLITPLDHNYNEIDLGLWKSANVKQDPDDLYF